MIRKMVVIALLGAAVYLAWSWMQPVSPPVATYLEFADAVVMEDIGAAQALTAQRSMAHDQVLDVPPCETHGGTYELDGTEYRLVAERWRADGAVEVELEQVIRLSLASDDLLHRYRHRATLRQTKRGWKVERFQRDPLGVVRRSE